MSPLIDERRLLGRLEELGRIGALDTGGRTRMAFDENDAAARRLVAGWFEEAGLTLGIDRLGSLYGTLPGASGGGAIMSGSHLDTVRAAGALDGCYGVVAALECLQAISEAKLPLGRDLIVAAFVNEEGVRFAPDMLGSRYFVGEIGLDEALAIPDAEGVTIGTALEASGEAGAVASRWVSPEAFIELHIEQGPVLDAKDQRIGVVEGVQGSFWYEVEVLGQANHAGTTPMDLRRDAGAAAAAMVAGLREMCVTRGAAAVATVGCFELSPGSLNIVPARARFTIDLRDPDADILAHADAQLRAEIEACARSHGVEVEIRRISESDPIRFDAALVNQVERCASRRFGASAVRRMVSGASHDAQIIAPHVPTAMIFVPSIKGVSHNPREETAPADLTAGAQLLCDLLVELAS